MKKGNLKIFFAKLTQKHLCQSLFFNEVAGLQQERLQHMCFPVNFAKILATPCSQNTSGRLLLENYATDKQGQTHSLSLQTHNFALE